MNEHVETMPQENAQEGVQEVGGMTDVSTNTEGKAFLKVKYNKDVLELDEEKAREYAQKGLNYDKVKGELDTYKANKTFQTDHEEPKNVAVKSKAEEEELHANIAMLINT